MPGVCLSAAVAFLALAASCLHPSFDALLMSPLMGMLLGNFIENKKRFEAGARFCVSRVLPAALGLYGAQMVFPGPAMKFFLFFLPYALGAGLLFFVITFIVARGFGLESGISLLLCAGLSVCGASGMAIISGVRGADRDDVSVSLISLWTVGLAGMFFMTFCPDALGLLPQKFAFMLGAALPSLGLIRAASASMGRTLAGLATSLKLIRTALLAPLVMVLYFMKKTVRPLEALSFIAVFTGLALAVNLTGPAGLRLSETLAPIGLLALSLCLAALGLTVDLDSIARKGAYPLLTALFAWSISVLFIYLAMRAL